MPTQKQQLEAAIAALEGQRNVLGDVAVEAMLEGIQTKLATLKIRSESQPQQTLKQVSILFMDVVGSTPLSQKLDPEEFHEVVNGVLVSGTSIVDSHGGRIISYAGDNLIAVFGAGLAREDSTENAVRAGLALLEQGGKLRDTVFQRYGVSDCNVRVGIHTGPALLGGGVQAENTISGLSVNIAARMEQTAGSGALRISHETYSHVRGLFEVEQQDPLQVKGVSEPMVTYLVRGARPRSFRITTRGIEGVITRMVGREAELELLQESFEYLCTEKTFTAVTVVGEAGVGKSRLMSEFEAWAEMRPEPFLIFRGRAYPHTEGQAFGLLRDVVAWRFQIEDADTVATAREKLAQGIIPLFEEHDGLDLAEAHAHLLGHLIGIDHQDSRHVRGILGDPRQIRNRALHAAAQLFRRMSLAQDCPVVLQIDDLHWADNESLDFLNYLYDVNRDMAMLVLVFTRPALYERRADQWTACSHQRRVNLASLDKTNSRLLANEILKKLPQIPKVLRELLIAGSEGNPFYMEELVNMLIDRGAIQVEPESWTVSPEKLLSVQVPATLAGVLQARLDGLPAAERLALQQASVIGQVFWDQALFALDRQAKEALPALMQRELTVPRAEAESPAEGGGGLHEYVFKNTMLHQVTYGTVLKRTRRALHGDLARWLATTHGLRSRDFLGLTAEHFEKAGEALSAAEFHVRAAEHAATRFAHDRVLSHAQSALLLLDQDLHNSSGGIAKDVSAVSSDLLWRAHKVRETALDILGRRPEQRLDLDAMEQLVQSVDDAHKRAYVAYRRSYLGLRTADWELMEASARQALPLAQRICDQALELRCMRIIAEALVSKGDWQTGESLAQDALLQARTLGLLEVQALCLNTLGFIANDMRRDVMAALDFDQQALNIARETGDRRGEAIGLGNLGFGWISLGALAKGRQFSEQALQKFREIGDRAVECNTLCNLSQLALLQGEDTRALSLARAAYDLALSVEARHREADALVQLGNAELALGMHAQAEEAYRRAHEVAARFNNPRQHDATVGLARLALSQANADSALVEVELLLRHVDSKQDFEGVDQPRLLELTCYQVFDRLGDPRAHQWLERAQTHLQATAQGISESALRQDFLNNISHHREIVAAWMRRNGAT